MTEDNIQKELIKKLPIKEMYNDVLHPSFNEVGIALQGVTKMALAPISALVWGYDQISSYLEIAIPKYFEDRNISKENIVTPDPSVAVPTIEAMRYTSHKPELREMFTNLLGASMNRDVIDEHPAFVEIIKQLSPDECKMLKYLFEKNHQLPILKIRIKLQDGKGEIDYTDYFNDVCYLTNCDHPTKFPEYLKNLERLGLVEIEKNRHFVDAELYNNLRKHQNFYNLSSINQEDIIEQKSLFFLSEFGNKFCKVCLK